jgi:hypothetical protein
MADPKRIVAVIGLWAWRIWLVGLLGMGLPAIGEMVRLMQADGAIRGLMPAGSVEMVLQWLLIGLVLQLLRRTLRTPSDR